MLCSRSACRSSDWTTLFFALFGLNFANTQFVHGYTALEAGIRLIAVGAGSSRRLVDRADTNCVVPAGMLVLAAVMASIAFWQVDTPYWVIGLTLFVLSAGMGNVPEAKAGVGSTMSDVVRQVTGVFGSRSSARS